MPLLKSIFTFELQLLVRQKSMLALTGLFLVIGFYSIYNGSQFTKTQLVTIDSLIQTHQNKLSSIKAAFHADTTTADGKRNRLQAGIPSVVEYKNPPYTINKPSALSALAIGQRDLMPYYDVVTRRRNFMQDSSTELTNPEVLASGNFDLAYVIIYLLPLLAIAMCYNVWSIEKERQTDKILAIQGAYFGRIIFYKICFRFLVVLTLAYVLSIVGFIVCRYLVKSDPIAYLLWLATLTCYIFFWFAIVLVIVRLGQNSVQTALYLLATWTLLIIILPSLSNAYVRLRYPVPLKTDAALTLRTTSESVWAMQSALLIETFYRNNPKYLAFRQPSDTSSQSPVRFAAYYDVLGRKLTRSTEQYDDYIKQQNQASALLSWVNPAIKVQQIFNEISENGLLDFLDYQSQVNRFQKTWVDFMSDYVVHNKNLSQNELDRLPEFKRNIRAEKPAEIRAGILYVMIISLLLLLLSKRVKIRI